MPTPIYALAPIEDDASSSQEVQSNTAPLTASTVQNAPSSSADTDNTPLISSAAVPTTPALQNSTVASDDLSLATLPMSTRVTRLEQQMGNMVHANLSDQIMKLQQQVQQLNGELQVQQHDITLLNQQVRTFYQDLSTQIKQTKNVSANSIDSSSGAALPAAPPVHSGVGAVASTTAQASNAYKTALNFLTKKQYELAVKGFNDYIKNYPTGNFVVNAHYWLGEINVMQHHLDKAIVEFNTVITQFPTSSQVPDAKVKLAIIHLSQGHVPQARAEFMKIKQQYPGTTAAQLADIQLQQLNTQ